MTDNIATQSEEIKDINQDMAAENAESLTESAEVEVEENGFDHFGLREEVLKSIKKLGFEMPSPIQEKSIQPLLEGRDVLGQAQTGTGKTAAFALPLLSRINVETRDTQVLIIAPTRELALQVAEACLGSRIRHFG